MKQLFYIQPNLPSSIKNHKEFQHDRNQGMGFPWEIWEIFLRIFWEIFWRHIWLEKIWFKGWWLAGETMGGSSFCLDLWFSWNFVSVLYPKTAVEISSVIPQLEYHFSSAQMLVWTLVVWVVMVSYPFFWEATHHYMCKWCGLFSTQRISIIRSLSSINRRKSCVSIGFFLC